MRTCNSATVPVLLVRIQRSSQVILSKCSTIEVRVWVVKGTSIFTC